MNTLFVALSVVAFAGMSTAAPAYATHAINGPVAHEAAKSTPISFAAKPKPGTKAKCPVMGSVFTVKADTKISQYKGRYYAFCCPSCKPKFDKNPSQYAGR